jgi:O-antigen/teichoic acid export membrane protein
MATIQKQSILSSIIITVGFAFGALNILILFPKWLSGEQSGLTRVFNDFGMIAATFASLGILPVVYKFVPYYRRYHTPEKNDLPTIVLAVGLVGCLMVLFGFFVFKPFIIGIWGIKSSLFVDYYFLMIPFFCCYLFFQLFEAFGYHAQLSVLANGLREAVPRIYTTIIVLLLGFSIIQFDLFIVLFAFLYAIPMLALGLAIRRKGFFPVQTTISATSRRLRPHMIRFGGFVFITSVISVVAQVTDTLFLAALKEFRFAFIFSTISFLGNVLEVPMRSITGGSIPVLAEYWRANNLSGIASIYRKSAMNLLIVGITLGGCIIACTNNFIAFMPRGKGYELIFWPVVIIILTKLVNLGTGLNSLIILTSNLWRFDLISNIVLLAITIPANYFLIKAFGLYGAAFSGLLSMTIYNLIRFIFIYRKFGIQPFSLNNLWVLLLGIAATAITFLLPALPNIYLDSAMRCTIFLTLFVPPVLKWRFSEEFSQLFTKYKRKLLG